jgi:hypothetical protein
MQPARRQCALAWARRVAGGLDLVDVFTASPSRRRRRRRWLDIHDRRQYLRPFLERRALLLPYTVVAHLSTCSANITHNVV